MHVPRRESAGKTIQPAINFVTNLFEPRDTNPPPQVCLPSLLAATHAARAAFGRPPLPLRWRCDRCTCCRCTRARAPSAPAPAPTTCLPRRAGLRATQLALPIGTCERAASPVLLKACVLLPRCRQPQLRAVGHDGHRALNISATTGRRKIDTKVARIRPPSRPRSPAWPRRREKPLPVSRARSSSRLRPRRRTARPAHHRVQRRRLRPDHYRHDRHNKHHHGLVEA